MKAVEATYKKPFSVGQVADICKVSNKTVLNWIYSGGLKAFTTYGGHYRLWPSNVRKFLEETRMDIPFELAATQPRHVLILHGDPLVSGVLRDALAASLSGVEVTATNDGYEGMVLIGEIQPEVIIVETTMPGIDATRLLNVLKARKRDRDTKIIATSGLMDPDTHTLPSTADAFMERIKDTGTLVKRVAGFLNIDAVHEFENP